MNDVTSPRVAARGGKKNLLWAIAVTALGLVFAWFLLTGKPKPVARPPEAALKPEVGILVAEPGPVALSVATQGTVEPLTHISLVAQAGGKVERVAEQFVDGAFFRRGDVLVQIEATDYEFAIARARSAVAAAEQRLAEERGRNRQAKREWRDLGTTEANALFLREPQMKAAEAALEAARADLGAAELALERTRIRAPFDGRIEAKRADIGQFVAAGTPVADIYATDVVQVRLPLTDTQLAALNLPLYAAPELRREVLLSARFGGQRWQWPAHIRRVEAVVDRQSRVVHAIAEVEQPFATPDSDRPPLTPGLFVSADIPTPPIEGLVQLPATALRSDDSILVVNDDNRLERRVVDVRRRSERSAWVAGLAAGTRVVAEQTGTLISGLQVEIAAEQFAAGEP